MILLLTALALAVPRPDVDEDPPDDDVAHEDDARDTPKRWGGLIIPLIGASTTDGFGFGLGGEVFRRPVGESEGYDLKITPSFYVNVRFNYTNNLVRVDWRAPDGTAWLMQLGFSAWANLAYIGVGGEDVIGAGGQREIGNRYAGPYGFVSATRPLGRGDWAWLAQVYGRGGWAKAAPGSVMEAYDPLGLPGATYLDATLGVANEQVDRWPMPTDGHILEVTATGGGTFAEGGFRPLVGGQIEAMAWRPVWPDRLTVGSRVLVMKTVGERPFFEQDKALGRWRDELGSEQALAGYGRTRTRGDGVVAALVEVRPHLFRVDRGGIEFAGHLSLTAELGWLYEDFAPGPPMPTVGVGAPFLWQQVVQLRPFLAWGWRRMEPDAGRRPAMQVGISVLDAL